jgi:outer membrane protein TolC
MRNIHYILFLLITTVSFSQEVPQTLSFQEAIDYALENNRTAKNAHRDIQAAKQQKWETIASGLPQLSATIDYNHWLKQQVSLIPAEFFGGNPGEFTEVAFGTKQTMNATATLNQKIFDGSYLVGLQSAKVFLEISKNAKEKTELEVRKAVIDAYGNVLLSEESIKILERNITVLDKNLYETTKIYENGLGEEESVEQLQITLSGIKSNLANTKC